MSTGLPQQGRPAGPPVGNAPPGSVRAARERMGNGRIEQPASRDQRPPQVLAGPAQRLPLQGQDTRPQTPPRRVPPRQPAAIQISRPIPANLPTNIPASPGAQWPLKNDVQQENITKRSPPRRPPRPSHVPSIHGQTMLGVRPGVLRPVGGSQGRPPPSHPPLPPQQMLRPPIAYQRPRSNNLQQRRSGPRNGPRPVLPVDYVEDVPISPAYASPNYDRPLTTSSGASNSSLGSIPDFPVPVPLSSAQPTLPVIIQQTPRRMPSVGPPSARRGPSSYYSQTLSYVSPITEESSEPGRSHGSYASSMAIPKGQEAFYLEEGEGSPTEDGTEVPSSGRSSQIEDHTDSAQLVRQASLGKRQKPALTTIKSSDGSRADQGANRSPAVPDLSALPKYTPPTKTYQNGAAAAPQIANQRALAASTSPPKYTSPTLPPGDQSGEVDRVLIGLEKGGAINANMADQARFSKHNSFGHDETLDLNRLPRLDMDAVRDAEVRGSLTSLPDLIRRATKLASNLDRGRTASKLGLEWIGKGYSGEKNAGGLAPDYERRSRSMSDLLRDFPPPGMSSPTTEKPSSAPHRPFSAWPINDISQDQTPLQGPRSLSELNDRRPSDCNKPARRCCGMRLWVFIMLLVILLILIAAAVVIPLALIVLPKDNKSAAPTTTSQAELLASCRSLNPCNNGGTAVIDTNGDCSCICINGFAGNHCDDQPNNACTDIAIDGVSEKATVGFAVSPLLQQADPQFGIQLDASKVLAVFSKADISCQAENALLTFNGVSTGVGGSSAPTSRPRQRQRRDIKSPSHITFHASAGRGSPTQKRSTDKTTKASPSKVTTGPPRSTQRPTSTKRQENTSGKQKMPPSSESRDPTPTSKKIMTAPSHPTSDPSPQPSPTGGVTKDLLDFARVSVLFTMQQTTLFDTGVTVQSKLQSHFRAASFGSEPLNSVVDVGSGFKVDLTTLSIQLPDGSSVGGKA